MAGEEFTSTRLVPGVNVYLPTTPENIVRPFESFRERRDQRLAQLRAPAGAVHEAELCWGRPAQFQGTNNAPPDGGGFTTKNPNDRPSPAEQDEPDYTWTEQKRRTKRIKVVNPEDSEDYVYVERIEEMTMTAPAVAPFNGATHLFRFRNR